MDRSTAKILVIEDSDEDFYATDRAFKKSGIANPLVRCCDGEEALEYLNKTGRYSEDKDEQLPNVILLDLNLPRLDGREFLTHIKSDIHFKKIPVIVLTTSNDEKDIEHCYAHGANSYIQKPVDLQRFIESIQRLKNYWFEIVVLPN
ncbi:response regulator [Thiotrichales bacterium 19X7-9]|nr:response regulator [Thiotrichales bacterium 19X7-9]